VSPNDTKVERVARLRWVPIPKMRVSPVAQRQVNQARVDYIAANFDPEQIGTPTVSERDGAFFVIDGQHRIEALKAIGWGDQSVQCWTYTGLTEQEEADKFDRLNDVLAVHAFDRYRTRVTAGREVEARRMAVEGYTSRQIGEAIGIKSMADFRARHGINVPADAVVGKTRRLDADRIINETVIALEGLTIGVNLLDAADLAALDQEQAANWATSLSNSLRSLNRLCKQLKEMSQ
jgi:hypothetical protein